jgi:hypothetical protein
MKLRGSSTKLRGNVKRNIIFVALFHLTSYALKVYLQEKA